MIDEETNEKISTLENDTNTFNTNQNLDTISSEYVPQPDCLSLTIRKDYNMTIIKNIFTSGR